MIVVLNKSLNVVIFGPKLSMVIHNIIQIKFSYDEWDSFHNQNCFYIISQIPINDNITNDWNY